MNASIRFLSFGFALLLGIGVTDVRAQTQDATPVAAPMVPDAAAPAPAPAASDAPVVVAPVAPAVPAEAVAPAPAPTTEEPVARAVAVPVAKPRFSLPDKDPSVPDLDYIGHRFSEPNDSGGWGWVRLPKDGWNKARWIAIFETPGVAMAPFRALGTDRLADQNYEYKMHGYFAPYQVYDPHTNEMIDVFVLMSWESMGLAQPLTIRSGPANRHAHVRSTFSSRGSNDDNSY